MHELSLVQSLVAMVEDSARDAQAARVTVVNLRIGPLAGVAESALQFAYDLVTANTLLAGSRLIVHHVPVVIYCPLCATDVVLENAMRFRCPVCDTPSAEIRSGREMDVDTIEIE